jgi:hypothetical protein
LFPILVSETHYFLIAVVVAVCNYRAYGRPLVVVTQMTRIPFILEIHLGRTTEACGINTGAEGVQINSTITDASGAAIAAVLSWLSPDMFVNVALSVLLGSGCFSLCYLSDECSAP